MAELAPGSSERDAEYMEGTSKGGRVGHQRSGLCIPTGMRVGLRHVLIYPASSHE